MKTKLSVLERITLLKIIPIPKEGNRLAFKMIYDLIGELSFSDKEYKDFGIAEKDNKISWIRSENKEIEIGDKLLEIIQNALKELDKAERLDNNLYFLHERFVVNNV